KLREIGLKRADNADNWSRGMWPRWRGCKPHPEKSKVDGKRSAISANASYRATPAEAPPAEYRVCSRQSNRAAACYSQQPERYETLSWPTRKSSTKRLYGFLCSLHVSSHTDR